MGVQLHFLLRLGCHSEQAGDERYLAYDISLVHPLHLPLSHQVHHLVSF